MTVIEIPAKIIHKCDGCQAEVDGKDRPKYWTTMKHYRNAYDFQGNACASDNIELLLCNTCTDIFTTVVNKAFQRED